MKPAALAALVCGAVLAGRAAPVAHVAPIVGDTGQVTMTATVTDAGGHPVSGLDRTDFTVIEDGVAQRIAEFDAARVPLSIGILIDASRSMAGARMLAVRGSLARLLTDRLDPRDEVFVGRFDTQPSIVQPWTDDRRAAAASLESIDPDGGTALYDAVAQALALARRGTRRRRVLLVVSDGGDTSSRTPLADLQRDVRASDVQIDALAIEAFAGVKMPKSNEARPAPSPFPGLAGGATRPAAEPSAGDARPHVDAGVLRSLTDDTGGRTIVIDSARDLDAAIADLAAEFSRQYVFDVVSSRPRDGAWHMLETRVQRGVGLIVRARRGYIAG